MLFLRGVCLFLLIITFNYVECNRKVKAVLNPGCKPSQCKDKNVILVHVKAEGDNDILHYLWDFTQSKKPSFFLGRTEKNATLNVDWDQFISGARGAISFVPDSEYMYGVVVDKIIEFNDENDMGRLDTENSNSSYISTYSTENFEWKFVTLPNDTNNALLTVDASNYIDKSTQQQTINGTVRFVLSAFGAEDHGESLPHLLHSGNASQIDVTLDGLTSRYPKSRFGLHFVTVSSDEREQHESVNIGVRQTLDDEHAPGVFEIRELLTPSTKAGKCGGYLQWRPVVYTSAARDMTNSTESVYYDVHQLTHPQTDINATLLDCLLGVNVDKMLALDTNITFGVTDDGFYKKTKYATWTVVMGYGQPPTEQFSMLVTLVLLIGLGLPAVVIVIGTVCIVCRRLQRNKDDLFLSR